MDYRAITTRRLPDYVIDTIECEVCSDSIVLSNCTTISHLINDAPPGDPSLDGWTLYSSSPDMGVCYKFYCPKCLIVQKAKDQII